VRRGGLSAAAAGRALGRLGLLVGGLLAALAASPARADGPPALGSSYRAMLDLGSQQIPLPEGEWVLAGRAFEAAEGLGDEAYGAMESVVLFRVDAGQASAFVIAHRNMISIEDGWGTASECGRDDLGAVVNFEAEDAHTFCGFVAAVDTGGTAGDSQAWQAALGYAADHHIAVPSRWLMAGFRLSDRNDVLDVRYLFADGVDGLVVPDPQHLRGTRSLTRLTDWLQSVQGLVDLGFENSLAGLPVVAMPGTVVATAAQPAVALQLDRLDELRVAGILPNDFYAKRRQQALAGGVTVAPEQISAAMLSLYKALADQATTLVENFGVNLLVLGSLAQTVILLPAQSVADMGQFYVHEYLWNSYGPSRAREAPEIDFAEAGTILASR
jgi:hypothetical protein